MEHTAHPAPPHSPTAPSWPEIARLALAAGLLLLIRRAQRPPARSWRGRAAGLVLDHAAANAIPVGWYAAARRALPAGNP